MISTTYAGRSTTSPQRSWQATAFMPSRQLAAYLAPATGWALDVRVGGEASGGATGSRIVLRKQRADAS